MQNDNTDFKEGLKATSLFGGVQVFKILISIINQKFIAVLLGPTGVGIMGLLTSTTNLITTASGLGLSTSAVRDVSQAWASGDNARLDKVVSVLRYLVWATGLLGLLLCAFLSPLWSRIAFGNDNYVLSFILLSASILFLQISSGQVVVLQGARKFKDIAKSGVIGSFFGLLTSVPLFYLFRQNGIVPSIIITAFTTLCLSYFFSKKIEVKSVKLNVFDILKEGNLMLKMGVFLALQSFLNLICSYFVRVYISHTGSIGDVGLYNSGFNIINTYVGMVFTAMGSEYYPRLASYTNDKKAFNNAVNQQLELALILISPLIAFFLVFGQYAIMVLYSSEFFGATNMIMFGILGVFFKAPGWCLGLTFVAKGDSTTFFYNELLCEIVSLFLNIFCYKYWGLDGLGFSFLFIYFIYAIQVFVVCRIKYKFYFKFSILKNFMLQFFLSLIILIVVMNFSNCLRYVLCSCIACISVYISYKECNNIVGIKNIILNRLKR